MEMKSKKTTLRTTPMRPPIPLVPITLMDATVAVGLSSTTTSTSSGEEDAVQDNNGVFMGTSSPVLPQGHDCDVDLCITGGDGSKPLQQTVPLESLDESDDDQHVSLEETVVDADQDRDTDSDADDTAEGGRKVAREELYSRAWNEKFRILVQHLNENKTWPRTREHEVLYKWTNDQRRRWSAGTLLQNRFEKLDELGFPWTGGIAGVPYCPRERPTKNSDDGTSERGGKVTHEDVRTQAWNEKFRVLVEHLNENKTWPRFREHKDLLRWTHDQRRRWSAGTLPQNRFERLDELGLPWTGGIAGVPYRPRSERLGEVDNSNTMDGGDDVTHEEVRAQAWDDKFCILVQYLKENKTWPTRLRHAQSYNWIQRQRRRRSEGTLPQNQFERLNELGFPWEGKVSGLAYKPETVHEEEGTDHSRDDDHSADHDGDAPSRCMDEMVLPGDDKHHGNAVVSTWQQERQRRDWQEQFDKLLAHLDAHQAWPGKWDYGSLNGWLLQQRKHKRINQLSSEDCERLDNLGFPWEGDLSEVPYCPPESQSHEEHSSIDECDQNGDGDYIDNRQQEKTLLYGEIHPDVINRELEWLGIPINQFNVERTDDRNGVTNPRKRKRKRTGTGTGTDIYSTLNRPPADHESENLANRIELINEEEEKEEDVEEHRRKRLSTRTHERSINMVPNVAQLPLQSTNRNESDDDGINKPTFPRRHRKQEAVHKVVHTDRHSSGYEAENEETDDDEVDRKVPAKTPIWDESFNALVSHLKEYQQWPNSMTDIRLAKWLSDQRRNKKKKRQCATERRVAKLNRLGMAWESEVPHKFVCPAESDIQHLRAWMPGLTMLQIYLEKHQRWPSKESNLDLHGWVRKQQSLLSLVHDDTPDAIERMQIGELDKVGIDWENDMSDQAFSPIAAYEAFHI